MNKTIDHLSSLPDDVLTHILSFMSAREAVQTCILSKRWRNTWASVPILKFNLNDFHIDESWNFDRFVDGVFEKRGSSHLDTVIYSGDFGYSICPSMKWLHRAALLMPRVITIYVRDVNYLHFPDSVFSCPSLENLDLSFPNVQVTIGPQEIVLPSLKILKLCFFRLDDNFTQRILLGCPSLETLKLYDCESFISDISSNVLKKLDLGDNRLFRHMRISCPGLVSLSIDSSMNSVRNISLENTASLVIVDIKLFGMEEELVDDILPNPKYLSVLSNATSLELYFENLTELKEQWEKDIRNCRTFKSLKSLEIGSLDMTNYFSLVACFLEHSPVLQQLTLHFELIENQSDHISEPK